MVLPNLFPHALPENDIFQGFDAVADLCTSIVLFRLTKLYALSLGLFGASASKRKLINLKIRKKVAGYPSKRAGIHLFFTNFVVAKPLIIYHETTSTICTTLGCATL